MPLCAEAEALLRGLTRGGERVFKEETNPENQHCSEEVVQGSESQKACFIPHRTAHVLCAAVDERSTDIHRAAVDVPLRHQFHQCLCRFAKQDQGQGSEEAADVHLLNVILFS